MRGWISPAILVVGAVLTGLAPIWVVTAKVDLLEDRIVGRLESEMTQIKQPNFHSTITTGGVTTDVNTYCENVPTSWNGTCAEYHKHQIDELKAAFP